MRSLPDTLSLLFLAACAGGSGAGSTDRATAPIEPTVRDSAGVAIYELPADAVERAPVITLDTAVVAAIGGSAIEDDVSHLRALTFLADGRIAGFDGDLGAVRIFGTDGQMQASYGRKGEGPGEFRMIERLVVFSGDSILAVEQFQPRATILVADSGVIRTERVPSRGERMTFVAAGALKDGSWLFVPAAVRLSFRTLGGDADTSHHPNPMGAYRPGSEADHLDTIAVAWEPPYAQFMQKMRGKDELGEGPRRYSAYPLLTAWNGQAAILPNTCWCIDRYDRDGSLHSIIRIPRSRFAITDQVRDSVIEIQLEDFREQVRQRPEISRFQSPEEVEYNARHAAWADSMPVFVQAMPGSGRLLWLRQAAFSYRDTLRFLAFDPQGRLVGRLAVPFQPRMIAISDDRAIMQTEDDDGIVRFEVHRLQMPD